MKNFNDVSVPAVPGLEVVVSAPNRVIMTGTITVQDGGGLSAFFRALHGRARENKLSEVELDVKGLRFVNSSAIRLFVDWATWVKNERGHRYTLRFITSRNVTWQKTAFLALMSLTKEVLAIEHVT